MSEHIIMPGAVRISFSKWWQSIDAETVVKVRFPHKRHGNTGKTSNSVKASIRDDFLQFVDNNSQPMVTQSIQVALCFTFHLCLLQYKLPRLTLPTTKEVSCRGV